MSKPCQWVDEPLPDEDFFALWRWWVSKNGSSVSWDTIAPSGWRDVPLPTEEQLAKYNLTDCEWRTGPMPGATD